MPFYQLPSFIWDPVPHIMNVSVATVSINAVSVQHHPGCLEVCKCIPDRQSQWALVITNAASRVKVLRGYRDFQPPWEFPHLLHGSSSPVPGISIFLLCFGRSLPFQRWKKYGGNNFWTSLF
jgi:hypothetical protein